MGSPADERAGAHPPPRPVAPLDLNQLAREYNVSVTPKQRPWDTARDFIFFVFGLAFLLTVGIVCAVIVLDAHASADDKKWATGILGSLVGGFIGRLTARGG